MATDGTVTDGKLPKALYEEKMEEFSTQLVRLQYWAQSSGQKILIIFEGRDAAGKGGCITALTESMNQRGVRVVALGKPSEAEKTQWYFQRYVAHLPSAGEVVIFDRSWYNRAGVEKVMGFCTPEEHKLFLEQCPVFEKLLVDSGIHVVKYWLSVSPEEEEKRLRARNENPVKRWKLSPMDMKARQKWVEYSRAKDEMFEVCDTEYAPWYQVPSDDKKKARLNLVSHFLDLFPEAKEFKLPDPIDFPPREEGADYQRPPITKHKFVPQKF